MSTFLGIGLGPIQTGIFLSGACQGGMKRLVVSEVDANLTAAVRAAGGITINIAGRDRITQEKIGPLEIYNPTVPEDLAKLVQVAAEADEIATALPGVAFFKHIVGWLKDGFAQQPDRRRFIYTAENDNYAAEKMEAAMGVKYPHTYYLNTVIGKMSKVCSIQDTPEFHLSPLCPGIDRAHLVESFNRIYINPVADIEQRQVKNLHVKPDLYPFEEAKLYGHNAVHFMLGWYAGTLGLTSMHEIAGHPELIEAARDAFMNESGQALCRKWKDVDPLFTADGFKAYVDDLLIRMVNPFLRDRVDRIIRDLPRKLDYNDRVIGTIRMCLDQQVIPKRFIRLAGDCFAHLEANPPPPPQK